MLMKQTNDMPTTFHIFELGVLGMLGDSDKAVPRVYVEKM
jgi:hypothetical protein